MTAQLAFSFAPSRPVYMWSDPGEFLTGRLAEAVVVVTASRDWSPNGRLLVVRCADGAFRAFARGNEWGWWRDSGHREAVILDRDRDPSRYEVAAYVDSGGCSWCWGCIPAGKARRLLQDMVRVGLVAGDPRVDAGAAS